MNALDNLTKKLTAATNKFNTFVNLKCRKLAGKTAYTLETLMGQIQKLTTIQKAAIASCNTKQFQDAISAVGKFIEKRPRHAILATVKLELQDGVLKVTTFSLLSGMVVEVPVMGQGAGAIAIPYYVFSRWIKTLNSSQLSIEFVNEEKISITTDSGTQNWTGVNVAEFPELPTLDGQQINIDLSIAVLKEKISKIKTCVSKQSYHADCFKNVQLTGDTENLNFYASNGHVAALLKTPFVSESFNELVSVQALEDMLRAEQKTLLIDTDWYGVSCVKNTVKYVSIYKKSEDKLPLLSFDIKPLADIDRRWFKNQLEIAKLFSGTAKLTSNGQFNVSVDCVNGGIDASTVAQIHLEVSLTVNIKQLLILVKAESTNIINLGVSLSKNSAILAIGDNIVHAKLAA